MDTVSTDRWYRIDSTAQHVAPVNKDSIARLARAFDADSAGRFETLTGITYSVGAQLTDVEIGWLQRAIDRLHETIDAAGVPGDLDKNIRLDWLRKLPWRSRS